MNRSYIKSEITAKINALGFPGVKRFFDDYQLNPDWNPVITESNYIRMVRSYMASFIMDDFIEPIEAFLNYPA